VADTHIYDDIKMVIEPVYNAVTAGISAPVEPNPKFDKIAGPVGPTVPVGPV
jgi:hypothetical protein